MALSLADHWVWDFWFAQDGPDTHIFYLQAPKSLGDPELRHFNASVGHAVSRDLVHWQTLPDALLPGREPAWDDLAIWTGSVIRRPDENWAMLYTGISHLEKGLVQRIGLATSQDLLNWQKHPGNPCLVADPRWYEMLDLSAWHDHAWRDPYLLEQDGSYYALVSARVNQGSPDGRGVIALARSENLVEWEVLPPISAPGMVGMLEVPQLIELDGRYILIFSNTKECHSQAWLESNQQEPLTGIFYCPAENPTGPIHLEHTMPLRADANGTFYSGKLVRAPWGGWTFVACIFRPLNGSFQGVISDPQPLDSLNI